jgi:hypothetical protein
MLPEWLAYTSSCRYIKAKMTFIGVRLKEEIYAKTQALIIDHRRCGLWPPSRYVWAKIRPDGHIDSFLKTMAGSTKDHEKAAQISVHHW